MRKPISDTGISIVYAPDEDEQLLDIVIVHGLQGHPFKTWASTQTPQTAHSPHHSSLEVPKNSEKGKSVVRRMVSKVSKTSSANVTPTLHQTEPGLEETSTGSGKNKPTPVFWPADLAPKECPKSRILMFGYDTKVSKYMTGPTNKNHVLSHGRDLVYALCRERIRDRPVVFVAHSLGGIVVKEALATSSVSGDSNIKNIVESTAAVIFMGTPHRGSLDLSALGDWARSLLSIFRMETTSTILDTLGLKNSDLERAQESFSRLWQKYDFRVKTFQEGLGLTGIHLGVLGKKVVPDYSSLLGDQREQAESIQANHMDMCRFTGGDDPNYRKVAGELRSIYLSIQRLNEGKVHQDEILCHPALATHMVPLKGDDNEISRNVADNHLEKLKFPTMNLRYRTITKPARNTCSWLFEHETYQNWLHNRHLGLHGGLLLLSGKPGAGKSVLMKEVYRQIARLQALLKYTTAAFFFNAQGQSLERTTRGMFQSLLYQILPKHQKQLDHFKRLNEDENDIPEDDLQELFESIFSEPSEKSVIIIIDALDECDQTMMRSVAYFWRDITAKAYSSGANLKVLMSTRHFPYVSLSNCPRIRVDCYNQRGIKLYIEQRTSLVVFPDQALSPLKELILEKSSGVFLWAVLAVDRMLERWDKGEGLPTLTRHMMDMPGKLDTLFTEILAPTNNETTDLAIRLFQWASLVVKPLRLHEWHHVLAFIRQPVPESLGDWRVSEYFTEDDDQLERQIRSLSRGLLEVRIVPSVHDGSETMSTRAGAGSLNLSHGETRVVEFIHETARDFFLEGRGFWTLDPSLEGNAVADGHLFIMSTCLEYLDISELDPLVEAHLQLLQRSAQQSIEQDDIWDQTPYSPDGMNARLHHKKTPDDKVGDDLERLKHHDFKNEMHQCQDSRGRIIEPQPIETKKDFEEGIGLKIATLAAFKRKRTKEEPSRKVSHTRHSPKTAPLEPGLPESDSGIEAGRLVEAPDRDEVAVGIKSLGIDSPEPCKPNCVDEHPCRCPSEATRMEKEGPDLPSLAPRQEGQASGKLQIRGSVFKSLIETSSIISGIDIEEWIVTNQFATNQGIKNESAPNSAAHPSTIISTRVLEDYPALLSYATQAFLTHAKLAQSAGADPQSIVRRFQDQDGRSWARWLILKEVADMRVELHDFATMNGLNSWLQYTSEAPDCSPLPAHKSSSAPVPGRTRIARRIPSFESLVRAFVEGDKNHVHTSDDDDDEPLLRALLKAKQDRRYISRARGNESNKLSGRSEYIAAGLPFNDTHQYVSRPHDNEHSKLFGRMEDMTTVLPLKDLYQYVSRPRDKESSNLSGKLEDIKFGIPIEDIHQYIEGPEPSDNKWVCTFEGCNKRFGRNENIESHIQTHLNNRQYQCPHCQKCFARQNDLKRHVMVHTGAKPYACECGSSFARHDALTRHRQCGMCVGSFDGVVRETVKTGRPRKERYNANQNQSGQNEAATTNGYGHLRTVASFSSASSHTSDDPVSGSCMSDSDDPHLANQQDLAKEDRWP